MTLSGTGKTFASAFAMRELGYKKVLFLVHRNQIADQALRSFKKVFGGNVSMGLVYGNRYEYDNDFIFGTMQTFSRKKTLEVFEPDHFDAIIIDEAHHSASESYKRIMEYFKPEFWLGMTATPDKRDDHIEGRNIYEIFDYNIACEIRLQDAMDEDLLCPFHYFGITDLESIADPGKTKKEKLEDFRYLTSDERVRNIMEQAEYFSYSGSRVKGLIFCSRIDEAEELSGKFNAAGWNTLALSGRDTHEARQNAIERLVSYDSSDEDHLDYILSVDIFSEGVDVPEINQVIMLRPTESPIVFIQQLGRGLRKAENKEYVVILDFIGNYTNNFMIPIALSGDRSYNPDTIRRYVISGNTTIPGASTVHFDKVSKDRIFRAIDKIKGIKAIIRESYTNLKNRLGRVPYLIDFYNSNEVDPLVIIKEFKTYDKLLKDREKNDHINLLSENEEVIFEYLSKTILSAVRPYELEILKQLINRDKLYIDEFINTFKSSYGYEITYEDIRNAMHVIAGGFVSSSSESDKYKDVSLAEYNGHKQIVRTQIFETSLDNDEFRRQISDLTETGIAMYKDKYLKANADNELFALYEKYSRRDVCMLMNCGRDISSTMYGMKRIDDDVFIFVTYHKAESDDEEKAYLEGKPDYADSFDDNIIFRWDTMIGRGVESSYMQDVETAARKHLFIKKSDAEKNFYYMGMFDIIDKKAAKKKDNKGKDRDIAKVTMKMHHPVREDILRFLKSDILEK